MKRCERCKINSTLQTRLHCLANEWKLNCKVGSILHDEATEGVRIMSGHHWLEFFLRCGTLQGFSVWLKTLQSR